MRVAAPAAAGLGTPTLTWVLILVLIGLGIVAPFAVYPIFLMKALAKSAKHSTYIRNTG
jgi:hypothetical protein